MAEVAIGAAVVSGLVKLIFDKLASPLFQKIGRAFGVKAELKKLSRKLIAISALLVDAEEKQTTLHSVRDWLLNLKDVAYDIEDVLDLISTQHLEKNFHQTSLARKVREKLPQFSLAGKLKAICGRLEEISSNGRNFNFQERQLPLPFPVGSTRGRHDTPFIQESSVIGRNEDKDWIVSRLVSSSTQQVTEIIQVLPIVGIGGMGKTTLTKLVFNDPRLGNFGLKLWASMPTKFTKAVAMEKIFEYATGEKSSDSNTQAIENRLHGILVGQTFLLVLDNVWLEDSREWVDLKEFLNVGSKSSRIIITTREERVASFAGTMEACKLRPLSDDDCWSIFVKYAFKRDEEKACPSLVQIGKDIVRKCRGVPLAAKTLGSQLWNVRDESYWKAIEENQLWEIEQAPDGILPALKLSFDQLPYILRACFSFSSTIITHGFFEEERIVSYWMALGLTESGEMNGSIEDTGSRYFNELVSRSFFEMLTPHIFLSKMNDPTIDAQLENTSFLRGWDVFLRRYDMIYNFQMHDLVHELAISVAGEETAFVSCESQDVSTRVKHLVWKEEDLSEREFPCQLLAAKKARSCRFDTKNERCCMSTSFLDSLISKFKRLRILSLATYQFEELPNSVGDLKHLRYLSLSGNNKLKRLPDSISNLVNLQTLDVSGCRQLELFPVNLHRLLSLRRLSFTSKVDGLLETSYHGWTAIQQITFFSCIHLTSLSERIGTLTTLRILRISTCPKLTSLPNNIQRLIALEELTIQGCVELNLSGWDGLRGLRHLRSLKINELPLLLHFPDGLQCTSGSLQHLTIAECQNLIALPECLQQCTSLLELNIFNCGNLSTLPRGIQALKSLQELCILECPLLKSRYERDGGEDWNLISHIPNIYWSM